MNYQNLLNSKIKEIKPSGIRRFFDIVAEKMCIRDRRSTLFL